MTSALVSSPVVSAALRTAGELLGVEAVFLGTFDEQTITLARVHGPADWVALREGRSTPRRDSLCQRMLDGGPAATSDAEHDPAYAPAATRSCLGLLTYVGVPITGADGRLWGTLCAVDRRAVPVADQAVAVLRGLAAVLAAHLDATAETATAASPVIRRTDAGWAVEQTGECVEEYAEDLLGAMVLADLLAGDLDTRGLGQRAGGSRRPHPAAGDYRSAGACTQCPRRGGAGHRHRIAAAGL